MDCQQNSGNLARETFLFYEQVTRRSVIKCRVHGVASEDLLPGESSLDMSSKTKEKKRKGS